MWLGHGQLTVVNAVRGLAGDEAAARHDVAHFAHEVLRLQHTLLASTCMVKCFLKEVPGLRM